MTRGGDDEALGVWLLRDVRDVFAETGVDRLSSAALAASLNEIETSPGATFAARRSTRAALARRLKRFEIRPRTVRLDDETTPKGYLLEQFEDAFSRYLGDSERHTATTRWTKRVAADSATATCDGRKIAQTRISKRLWRCGG